MAIAVCLSFCNYSSSLKIENRKALHSPNCALIPAISKEHNLRVPQMQI